MAALHPPLTSAAAAAASPLVAAAARAQQTLSVTLVHTLLSLEHGGEDAAAALLEPEHVRQRIVELITHDSEGFVDPFDHESINLTVSAMGCFASDIGGSTVLSIDKNNLRHYVRAPSLESFVVGLVAMSRGEDASSISCPVVYVVQAETKETYDQLMKLLDAFFKGKASHIDSELSLDSGVGGSGDLAGAGAARHQQEQMRSSRLGTAESLHRRTVSESDLVDESAPQEGSTTVQAQMVRQAASNFLDRLTVLAPGLVFDYHQADAGKLQDCFYCKDAISFLVQQGDFHSRADARLYMQTLFEASAVLPVKSLARKIFSDSTEIFRFAPGVAGRIRSVSMSVSSSINASRNSLDTLVVDSAVGSLSDLRGELVSAIEVKSLERIKELAREPTELSVVLVSAAQKEAVEIVTYCVDHGAKLDHRDKNGQTALHIASFLGNNTIAKKLLEAGADPESRDHLMQTPLALAAVDVSRNPTCVLLLEFGARLETPDKDGKSPADMRPELAETLQLLCQSCSDAFTNGRTSVESLLVLGRLCRNPANHKALVTALTQPEASQALKSVCTLPGGAGALEIWLRNLFSGNRGDLLRIFSAGFAKIALPLIDVSADSTPKLLEALAAIAGEDEVSFLLGMAKCDPRPLLRLVRRDHINQSKQALKVLTAMSRLPAGRALLADYQCLDMLVMPLRDFVACLPEDPPLFAPDLVAVLANIAADPATHRLLADFDLEPLLLSCTGSGIMPRLVHHATRVLVYLGCPDIKASVFKTFTEEHAVNMPTVKEEAGVEYPWSTLKGIDLELMVNATTDLSNPRPCDQLFAVSSVLWDPLSIFRMYRHRFYDQPLDAKAKDLPPLHARVLSLLERWMVMSTQDFDGNDSLLRDLKVFFRSLEAAGGKYSDEAARLKDLALQELDEDGDHSGEGWLHATALHNRLYESARDQVLKGNTQCTEKVAITLAAIQVHIEDLQRRAHNLSSSSTISFLRWRQIPTVRPCPSFKLKRVMPPMYAKPADKEAMKLAVEKEFARACILSDRDAKHQYLRMTQVMTQHGCSYFRVGQMVAEPSPKDKNKSKPKQRKVPRLLGVGHTKLVLLDPETNKVMEEQPYTNFRRFDSVWLREKNKRGLSVVRAGKGQPHLILSFRTKDFVIAADEAVIHSIADTMRGCIMEQHRRKRRLSTDTELMSIPEGAESNSNTNTPLTTPASGRRVTVTQRPESQDMTPAVATEATSAPAAAQPTPRSPQRPRQQAAPAPLCKCSPTPQLGKLCVRDVTLKKLLAHPKEFARQYTLSTFYLFKQITPEQCVARVLRAANASAHAQPASWLDRFVTNFNKMSSWFAFIVVDEPEDEPRAAVISHMIAVAQECHALRNFDGMMTIVSALGSSSVRRLTQTWSLVNSELRQKHEAYEKMLIINQKTEYRKAWEAAKAPAVPYFGLFLSDLTFLNDGNSDYVRSGFVNVFKWFQICKTLRSIQKRQADSYNLIVIPEIQALFADVEGYDDDSIYHRSLEVCPRVAHN